MLDNYIPVLIFIVIGLGLGAVMIMMGAMLAPHRPDSEKQSPYE